jgi:cupin 2 domain-containing protein
MIAAGNLYAGLSDALANEHLTELVSELLVTPRVRIERIVSRGQVSPPGFWYDQDDDEWVVLLAGAAGLLIEGEAAPRNLKPGDYVHLPAHTRHRVDWTDTERATVWLAVHIG